MVIILYMHHHLPDEIEGAREFLPSSEIVFLEFGVREGVEEFLEHFRNLSTSGEPKIKFSKNEATPEVLKYLHPYSINYLKSIGELLKNSGKRIEIEESPISADFFCSSELLAIKGCEAFLDGDFIGAKDYLEEYLLTSAEIQKAREEKLVEKLSELQEENENNNILALLGAFHTPIFWDLRKKELDVKRHFSRRPYVFSYSDEISRRARFGKKIEEEGLLRYFFDVGLRNYLGLLSKRFSGLDTLPQDARETISIFSRKVTEGKLEGLIENILPELRKAENLSDDVEKSLRIKGRGDMGRWLGD